MKYTPQELSILNLVLSLNPDRQARTFPFAELAQAFSIHEKIMKNTKEEVFVEWEVELTSEEKVFLSRLIKEFKFHVADWVHVTSLITKLV